MKLSRLKLSLSLVLTSIVMTACGGHDPAIPSGPAQPEPIAEHDCAACGMIVREQPSPRGQVVHHDGEHAWFCSIGDLVAYLGAPSPHGRVVEVWVETQPADVDPGANDVSERPWAQAAGAFFVLGIERERVMGAGVLAFASESDARAAAARLGGRMVRWDELVPALGGTL
jgi:nitrous oxide reductase accessory protein NosL